MARPIFSYNSDHAFDATTEHIFSFMWSNVNNQAIANTLIIRNNETNKIVYSQKQDTLLLQHTLKGGVLTNGVLYNATINVTDINGTVSDNSSPILFYCYSTPVLNVEVNNVVQSSSCSVNVSYFQNEGEELQMFKIELYNSMKELLYTSSLRYNVEYSVIFNGLVDNTTYYVKAIGQTINNMYAESDYAVFTVNYIAPDFYAYITAENRYNYGDIQFTSNLVSIEGSTIDGSPPTFVNGDCVDTINGTSIKFDENFTIQNNFSIIFTGYGMTNNQELFVASNLKNYIKLFSRYDVDNLLYIELNVIENNVKKILHFSNKIHVSSSDMVKIMLRNENGYFNISIEKVGD